jgi:hypothetical protein
MKVGYVFVEFITVRLNQKYAPCFNINTQPPIQLVPEAKLPRREADHLPQEWWSCTTTPLYAFMT